MSSSHPDPAPSISESFTRRAELQPDAIAVEAGGHRATYAALDADSNRLARRLGRLGVQPGDIVGVLAERGLETVVSALAVMKAGAAYVPLDPESPRWRTRLQLSDARAQCVLTPEGHAAAAHDSGLPVIALDRHMRVLAGEDDAPLGIDVSGEDLCAVLFTSGSTGRPKGVALEHRNFVNLLRRAPELTPAPGEGALHICAPQFDIAAYELWATLLAGGRLVCQAPGRPDPRAVCHTIAEHGVTWSAMPTSIFHQVIESDATALAGMRMLVVGGEAMLPGYAARFRRASPETRLVNAYGPAETTAFAFAHELGAEIDETQPVPIGRALAGTLPRILDERGAPVARGERGELYVGGPGVSRGYLHQPGLTAARYVTDRSSGERLYRTGDLVCERPDGVFEIFGRADDQIKVSGYRVEPAEVATHLSVCPSVRQAAVLAREDVPGHRRLVAYVVFAGGPGQEAALRAFLAERVPPYMLPSAIVALERMPMTANGKIDRVELAATGRSRRAAPVTRASGELALSMARIFAEVLHVEDVAPAEDFFELGGNSLLAVQVLARLRAREGLELPIAAVFMARTAQRLAESAAGSASTPAPPPLQQRAHDGPVPASMGQAKALLLSELADESLPYQSQSIYRILGELDVGALERALSGFVHRHESIRTTFLRSSGRWVQRVHEPYPVRLPIADVGGEDDPERALQRHFADACSQRLDPSHLPLVRWSLIRLAEDHHALLSIEHHAVQDGSSNALFLAELSTLYTAEHQGSAPALEPQSVQYADFAAWQAELLDSEFGARTLEHWRERLADAPPPLELPRDHCRPPRQTFRGETLRHPLSPELTDLVRRRAREWEATPFMVMLAAYSALLAIRARIEDVVIGSGMANRRSLASEELYGMLVNTVALRIDMHGRPTTRDLLARVRTAVLDAQAHQEVPFEAVVEHLAPARVANTAPLYQTLFSFHDSAVRTRELPGAVIVPGDALGNGSAKADLSVVVIDRPGCSPEAAAHPAYERVAEDGLTVLWEYNTDLFEPDTARRMLADYEELLERFLGLEDTPIAELLPLGGEVGPAVAVSGPATKYERDSTIAEVFGERAVEAPHAIAVSFGGEQLSYAHLERRSNRLAHRLMELGVHPGTRVGVCMERSLELIVGLLAVAKAGGTYVTLDPADPTPRIERSLRMLGAPLLLSLARHRAAMPGPAASVLYLDDELDLSREPDVAPERRAGALDPAYVMFTSGSTGAPKGVEVPHRAILRLVRGADYVRLDREETLLGFAPSAFDASTFEIWGALLNGGRLALAPPGALTLGELQGVIVREHVTTAWLTSGLFHRAVEDRPEMLGGLRQLLTGGDVLSPRHVRAALGALAPGAVLINGYGPTESTTFACVHRMSPGEEVPAPVPIGLPISNTCVYILDHAGRPVAGGLPGELHIGGDGLALGYAEEPELTAERFLADPFGAATGARMYRTGDLARLRDDGTIEFLGREDRQLKIRGFRVEPQEIEEALRAHPAVADVAVAPFERAAGDRALAAHVVLRNGSAPAVSELRAHAARTLPSHAVPTAWSRLERLPLTANGKLDLPALRQPVPGASWDGVPPAGDAAPGANGSVRPADKLERRLIAIWERALDRDGIGPEDDFFDIGGHSLLAVEVFDAIERSLGVRLPLSSIFESPTPRALAASLREEGWRSSSRALVTLTPTGSRPPLFFVSAGDGNSVGFGALARRLGPDQPFYALQPRGLNGGAPLHVTVEAMAALYLREIRRIRPHGPYLLGGRCLGAVVAYEIARLVEAVGEEVGLLAVLDSGGPRWHPRPLADGTPFDEVMSSALLRARGGHERVDRHGEAQPRAGSAPAGDIFGPEGTERLLAWLSQTVLIGPDGTPVNRYLDEVYRLRADVRDIYPDLAGGDAVWFVGWAWTQGRAQYGLTERLLPTPPNPEWERWAPAGPVRRRLDAARARIGWRSREAADLLTRERRAEAAVRRAARVREAGLLAWYAYRAGPYGGKIALIRSDEPLQPLIARWHGLDTAGVLEHHVRGTHRSMLREPDVQSLAACVAELARAATEGPGSERPAPGAEPPPLVQAGASAVLRR
jgi:amino acid adenylation domain-containing protein